MVNPTYKKGFFTVSGGGGTTLPTYVNGQYLINDGTNLSWAANGMGDLLANGTVPLTADWNVGAFDLTCVDMNATNFKLSGVGTLTSALGNVSLTTSITHASANEAAFTLNYTTNKAAGNDTGLQIVQTDTASPGTSYLIEALVGSDSKFSVDNGGWGIFSGGGSINIRPALRAIYCENGGTLSLFSNSTDFGGGIIDVTVGYTTKTNVSGTVTGLKIESIYNQASGTSANTDLLINRTEGAVGSGTQRLISAGTGGGTYAEKFAVDNGGLVYSTPIAITAGTGTGLTVNSTGNLNRQVYKVTVTYAGFSAAALTADHTIATLPAKTKIVGFYADTTVSFTGGTVSAATLTVGKSAGGVEYIAIHDVKSAAITKGLVDADMGTELTRAAAIQGGAVVNWTGTTTVSARITTVTANTDQLAAGSTTFYIVTERY